ncbi:MAG TPA: type II secretion system F family protein [Pseudolabrys sp.]|nr:type II secretion system F family protein [Pseudolabrys sp.]HZT27005.1 type II secretion system F family protein [Pseudolabrys sp.]
MDPNALILVAAAMLMAGGVSIIASVGRARSEVLTRRVALVEPPRAPSASAKGDQLESYLFRLPATGLTEVEQREVVRRLARLGIPASRALVTFGFARFAAAALLGVLAYAWARNVAAFHAHLQIEIAIPLMGAIVGWFVPLLYINYSVKQRIKEVRSGLPDALELLVVCVEAGLSLEDALARVVTELARSQAALADELGLTLADLRILPSRDQALSNFAERVNVPSVRSVVTTLAQTLRYGTPLAQSLRVVAGEMRNDYLIDLEERANRLPAYLTLPVIVFLMPTIFLIVGGPAALRLLDAFSHIHLG